MSASSSWRTGSDGSLLGPAYASSVRRKAARSASSCEGPSLRNECPAYAAHHAVASSALLLASVTTLRSSRGAASTSI